MGHAARRKQATDRRYALDRGDFHELVSKLRQVEVLRLEAREKAARLATEMVQKEIALVEAEKRALFEALATKYGFDATLVYRFDEPSCALIAVESDVR